MNTKGLSQEELTVLRNALEDYAVRLRTVSGKVVTERKFYEGDFSKVRMSGYQATKDMLNDVRDVLRESR